MLTDYFTAATIVALIVSVVIPLLSSLLSRAHWPQEITGILTLVISAANGFFTEWAQAGDAFDWRRALGLTIESFIIAVLARYGLWKNTQTDAKLLRFPSPPPGRPAPEVTPGPTAKAA